MNVAKHWHGRGEVFAISDCLVTFANVVGRMLCIHPRLLLCKIVDFCKVYWSPRSVCLFVCLLLCKIVDFCKVYWSPQFVCLLHLSVCSRCTGHNTGPIVLILCQLVYSGPTTMAKCFGQNRPIRFFLLPWKPIAQWWEIGIFQYFGILFLGY